MKVSYFKKATDNKSSKEIELDEWFRQTINPPQDLKSLVLKYRFLKSKSVKLQVPCITISASFKKIRNLNNIKKKTGLICLDIDKDINVCADMEKVKTLFKEHPSTMYVGYSISRQGLYAIMSISKKEKLIKYFKFFRKRLGNVGINIDESCKDYTRLRFFSYDIQGYYNPSPIMLKLPKKNKPKKINHADVSKSDKEKVEMVVSEIEKTQTDITGNYNDWIKIAGALNSAFGENGREYFHRISKFYSGYKKKECDRKYSNCRNMKRIEISSFFYVSDYHGIRY